MFLLDLRANHLNYCSKYEDLSVLSFSDMTPFNSQPRWLPALDKKHAQQHTVPTISHNFSTSYNNL